MPQATQDEIAVKAYEFWLKRHLAQQAKLLLIEWTAYNFWLDRTVRAGTSSTGSPEHDWAMALDYLGLDGSASNDWLVAEFELKAQPA